MDIDRIAQAAEAELDRARDAKVQTIRELALAGVVVDELRERLAAAERDHAAKYAAAQRSGWDEKTLRKLGIQLPERRTSGRPRKPREISTD
jgi:hypothetical protein